MATASGINKKVTYAKETEFGKKADKAQGTTLRRVTANFNLTKETYQSEEIRPDYQMQDFRHGVRSVDGSLSGELSCGSYSDFLASAVARNFTATTVTALGSVDIASTAPTYTITRSTGDFIADGVRVGNVVRLTGMNAGNNDKNLLIIALTETVATVITLNGSALVGETVASGATLAVIGGTTFAPSSGHTDDSYTMEEWYGDIQESEVTVGNKVNTVGIALPATGLTTIDFGFMGQNLDATAKTEYYTNPTPAGSSGIFAAVNGAMLVDGKVVALVTAANFNINRNMTSEAVVGSNIKPEIYEGRILVDGDFSTLFQDRTFSSYFDNETEVSFVIALTENNLPDCDFMAFTLPRIKLSTDTKDDGEKGIVAQNSFQALKGFGTNGYEATTIMIQDSLLA